MPYDENGHELLDTTPVAVPVGFRTPPTLQETIKRYIRAESELAASRGYETEEEADDFDVGDDPMLTSPYELSDEVLLHPLGPKPGSEQSKDGVVAPAPPAPEASPEAPGASGSPKKASPAPEAPAPSGSPKS